MCFPYILNNTCSHVLTDIWIDILILNGKSRESGISLFLWQCPPWPATCHDFRNQSCRKITVISKKKTGFIAFPYAAVYGCLVQSFGAWMNGCHTPLTWQNSLRQGMQWIPISNIYLRYPSLLVSIIHFNGVCTFQWALSTFLLEPLMFVWVPMSQCWSKTYVENLVDVFSSLT